MPTAITASELLHVKEAAVELGQHEVSVRRHIAAGRLRAVRLGPNGRVRVPREALHEFLCPYRAMTTDRPGLTAPSAQAPA